MINDNDLFMETFEGEKVAAKVVTFLRHKYVVPKIAKYIALDKDFSVYWFTHQPKVQKYTGTYYKQKGQLGEAIPLHIFKANWMTAIKEV